jgi:small subunit ribosomal protein S16
VSELRRKVAVKIRLKRLGKIRAPYYRIVVADSRTKRDGRVIEEIGKYHPTEEPSFIEIDSARAQYWLGVGAQPTEQVTALLKLSGDWGTFKGEKGAKSTIRTKAEPELFVADEKKKPVLKPKAEKPVKVEAPAEVADQAPAADEAVAAPVEDDVVGTDAEASAEAETPAETVTDAEDAVDEAEGSGAAADEVAADDASAAETAAEAPADADAEAAADATDADKA